MANVVKKMEIPIVKCYCCSKYGWCGKTEKYCDVDNGCQSEFGRCNFKDDEDSDYEFEKENKITMKGIRNDIDKIMNIK